MGRLYAVAINTFREAVRDRVLHGILGCASAVLVFTLALAELSLNQQARVVHDIGLASISLFSVVVSIFLGSSLLYKEIERKTLYVILPKPIRRHEFLLGKYFGIVLTALVFVAIMGGIQLLVAAWQAEDLALGPAGLVLLVPIGSLALVLRLARDRTAVVVPWAAGFLAFAAVLASLTDAELGPALAQLVLVVGEVLVLTAVALLFSSFSTPFLTGLFTFGVWLMGRSADDMQTMDSQLLDPSIVAMLRFLAEVLPNLYLYVPAHRTLADGSGPGGPWLYVATSMGYAVIYAAVTLVAAALIFRRRDFL
jgi:ABC-type transport system involved in multi-copper enzyme maturation permease subunit